MSQLDSARQLAALGFAVIPIEHRQKAPKISQWESLRIGADDLPKYFKDAPGNVGVILGLNGVVDVDLDCPEACAIADDFLPETHCVFGRRSAPASHRIYKLDTAVPFFKVVDPVKRGDGKTVLVELRGTKKDGSIGLQTVISGYHKDTEEPIGFFNGCTGVPSETTAEMLTIAVKRIAAVVLLFREEPGGGKRNPYFMALGGMLVRHGWDFEEAYKFMSALWSLVWPGAVDKQACETELRSTYQKFEAGGEVTDIPKLKDLVTNKKALSLALDLLGIGADEKEEKARRAGRREQEADDLQKLLQNVEFFNDATDPFARIEVNGHHECWQTSSKRFRQIISARFHEMHKALPSKEGLNGLIDLCDFQGMQGPVKEVFSRIGHGTDGHGKRAIYLDLGDDAWRAVEITANGWHIVAEPRVYFRRSGGMLPLPVPEEGGSLDELRPLINASREDIWILICAWLVGVFQPTGAQAILLASGEQGSAKTALTVLLRTLVDPNVVPLSGPPESPRDFAVSAVNAGVGAYDNLSGCKNWFADAMCRVSSGAGFRTRSLYTNTEEQVLKLRKPLILNGIDQISDRNDLLDRCIGLNLERIADDRRISEEEVFAAFGKLHGRILGALLTAVSAGLRNLPHVKLPSAPRMIDFCRWVIACEPALPWASGRFLDVYSHARFQACENAVEDDPFALALAAFARTFKDRVLWVGSARELLDILNANDGYRSERWPRDATAMGRWLRRAEPALRAVGVLIEHRREGKERARKIAIRYESPMPNEPGDAQGAAVAELPFELDEAA